MEWHVFKYQNPGTPTFSEWLEKLLNGVHAEQFVVIDKNTVAAYLASNYRDEFDANGNQL